VCQLWTAPVVTGLGRRWVNGRHVAPIGAPWVTRAATAAALTALAAAATAAALAAAATAAAATAAAALAALTALTTAALALAATTLAVGVADARGRGFNPEPARARLESERRSLLKWHTEVDRHDGHRAA